jgi:hypothetical protein
MTAKKRAAAAQTGIKTAQSAPAIEGQVLIIEHADMHASAARHACSSVTHGGRG